MQKFSRFSIIIPVKNEAQNVEILTKEIYKNCKSMMFEVIFINDGSTDNSIEILSKLKNKYKNLQIINHKHSLGQSAALRTGILRSINNIIVTMDGDCQNDPADIKKILIKFHSEKNDLVLIGGVRKVRKDNVSKRMASKIARHIRRIFLNDEHPDSGCGIKIFHKKLYLLMPYFDHMHRFLPALAKREGGKVLSIDVNHRIRHNGKSNYTNLGRLIVGVSDMIGVMWLIKRSPSKITIEK